MEGRKGGRDIDREPHFLFLSCHVISCQSAHKIAFLDKAWKTQNVTLVILIMTLNNSGNILLAFSCGKIDIT